MEEGNTLICFGSSVDIAQLFYLVVIKKGEQWKGGGLFPVSLICEKEHLISESFGEDDG